MLDIQLEIQKLNELYQQEGLSKFNALIAGESGSGKTSLARSCPDKEEINKPIPVFIDSFCAGGTRSVRDLVASGKVVADVRWEKEDPKNPTAFLGWDKAMEERIQQDFFSHVGTYMLDEITSLCDTIMNQILKGKSLDPVHVKDLVPQTSGKGASNRNDYVTQRIALELWIKRILQLPCNVIVTAHLAKESEDSPRYVLNAPGQARVKLPQLFDEFYTLRKRRTSSGTVREFLTEDDAIYPGRSRLSMKGLLNQVEPPDIRAIMKKVGLGK
jgi:hypothetical protein